MVRVPVSTAQRLGPSLDRIKAHFRSILDARTYGRILYLVLALPHNADVEIELFDLQGRRIDILEVARMPAGRHVLSWNGARHASGIYFARLLARTDSESVRRNVRVLSIR